MCRPEPRITKTHKEKLENEHDNDTNANVKSSSPEMPKLRLSQFFDINEAWVLVPNGSFMGHFDNVPISFRVGPWNIVCCVYLFALIYWILWECVQCYNNPPKEGAVDAENHAYFDMDTWQWYYNAAGFAWSLYICYRVTKMPAGFGSWITYTLQSWTLITVRHGLSTLAPFLPQVAMYNEYLRFPMLLQTTIVFMLWNFALFPAVAMTMKNPKNRWGFIKFCFSFCVFNLHFVNLPLAVVNGVWGSPVRELNKIDFCVALIFSLQYILFYLFILDRLGMHLYFIFSPRSPLALVSWSALIGCIYAGFSFWKDGILNHGITAV